MELMRMHYQESRAADLLAQGTFRALTARCNPVRSMPAWLLVGSPHYPGDSLGPEVGNRLRAIGFPGLFLGTSDDPVDGRNLYRQIHRLCELAGRTKRRPFIIAVDAAVQNPGWFIMRRAGLRAGEGVRQDGGDLGPAHPPVGSLTILGSTVSHPDELRIHRPGLVDAMADVLKAAIIGAQEMWDEHVMSEYELRVAAALAGPDE